MVKWVLVFALIFTTFNLNGQTCSYTIRGIVVDGNTDTPLPYVTVSLTELNLQSSTDSLGRFTFKGICPGHYHLYLHHLAYEPIRKEVIVDKDVLIQFSIQPHVHVLDNVAINDHGILQKSAGNTTSINHYEIAAEGHKNFAEQLEKLAGVSVLSTGTNISKPVINGMYGNRISIVNNGIEHSGQQWGNDHAPEIDPYMSDHVALVSGVQTLVYANQAMADVVLVDNVEIASGGHLHGEINYGYSSNGRGHHINSLLERRKNDFGWRVSLTGVKQGDSKAPDYYLTNTGKEELNFSVFSLKEFGSKWKAQLFYSLFNTQLGILRGSHVSNLSDLEEAIGRPEPFFTEDDFSYQINAPSQKISHHLVKTEIDYLLNKNATINLKYGWQFNNRREFDVRRAGRSEIPAMSIQQYANELRLNYNEQINNRSSYKLGLRLRQKNDNNDPETGILPLIPDNVQTEINGYGIYNFTIDAFSMSAGIRYNRRLLNVDLISRTLPRRIINIKQEYNNWSLGGDFAYQFTNSFLSKISLLWTQRPPEINELYSFGLHQGVSGIEEGNPDLRLETGFKILWNNQITTGEKITIQNTSYSYFFNNYIYLEPQNEFRLTIRGAFPVFAYQQTNAVILGNDLKINYNLSKKLNIHVINNFLVGKDSRNDNYLIYMPPNAIKSRVTYEFNLNQKWQNTSITLLGDYIFEQKNHPDDIDFMDAPPGYFSAGFQFRTDYVLSKSRIRINVQVENLFDVKYRNYLNRFRYFADDVGRNVNIRLGYLF